MVCNTHSRHSQLAEYGSRPLFPHDCKHNQCKQLPKQMQTDAQSGTSTVQLHYVVMAVKIHNKTTENVKFCTMPSCKPMHKAAKQIYKHCKSELRGIHVQVHYTTNPTSMILQKLRCHTYTHSHESNLLISFTAKRTRSRITLQEVYEHNRLSVRPLRFKD